MSKGKKEILLGDCLELMKDIPNGSIEQNTDKNLNISDVIKRLSEIQRYTMVEGGNNIHRLIHTEKNDNGEWIHYSVIEEITKMLKQINVL